jgi:transcriptional regulator of acetoin/glycerol metabolism
VAGKGLNNRHGIDDNAPTRFLKTLPFDQWPVKLKELLPNGTGKEQLARHAHAASGRTGAFVPVKCAALPESLIEAELFGWLESLWSMPKPLETSAKLHGVSVSPEIRSIGH